MTQYYKNTLDIALAKYRAGAMNAVGLLFDYIKVKFRPDWRIVLNPKKVCQELEISNSTFYRSLKKVQQLLSKAIHIRTEKVIPSSENPSPIGENKSPTSENKIPTRENQNPQTANKINTSSDTPEFITDLDQISLSQQIEQPKPKPKILPTIPEEEREKFLSFAMSKVEELPQRPTLPKKWIAANWSDLYAEYKEQEASVVQENDADKQFEEWYDLMCRFGHAVAKREENGVLMICDNSGYWSSYEDKSKFWKLSYLKKLLRGK